MELVDRGCGVGRIAEHKKSEARSLLDRKSVDCGACIGQ